MEANPRTTVELRRPDTPSFEGRQQPGRSVYQVTFRRRAHGLGLKVNPPSGADAPDAISSWNHQFPGVMRSAIRKTAVEHLHRKDRQVAALPNFQPPPKFRAR
jgi:hypothetical protein